MMLCRLASLLIVFAIWFLPGNAQAARKKQPTPVSSAYENKAIATGATVWYCAYDGNTEILCRLGAAGEAAIDPDEHETDARLPRLVHDIRQAPQRLAGQRIAIPLYTPPVDFDMVGELAESVMCGSRAFCGVIFAETSLALEQLVRVFEDTRRTVAQLSAADATRKAGDATDSDDAAVKEEFAWGVPLLRFAQAAR